MGLGLLYKLYAIVGNMISCCKLIVHLLTSGSATRSVLVSSLVEIADLTRADVEEFV